MLFEVEFFIYDNSQVFDVWHWGYLNRPYLRSTWNPPRTSRIAGRERFICRSKVPFRKSLDCLPLSTSAVPIQLWQSLRWLFTFLAFAHMCTYKLRGSIVQIHRIVQPASVAASTAEPRSPNPISATASQVLHQQRRSLGSSISMAQFHSPRSSCAKKRLF